MEIRRLEETDQSLLIEAYGWDKDYPAWYQAQDAVNRPTLEDFLGQAKHDISVGIWDGEFIGLIALSIKGNEIQGHLFAKRGSNIEVLSEAAYQIKEQLLRLGMAVGYLWTAKKNLPIRKLCANIGMWPDAEKVEGEYRGKPIHWLRYRT